jgi:acetyl esterase/lipase
VQATISARISIAAALLFCSSFAAAQPQELRLWPHGALGSESWAFPETVTTSPSGDRIVTNVREPTLTVFLPEASRATGAAVVVAPGGALRLLSLDNEGTKVAEWLNARGIAAFVLKYRTLQLEDPRRPFPPPPAAGMPPPREIEIRNANANPAPNDAALSRVLELAVADAQQALRLVRSNAAEWRVDPARVGLMGFSAGGGVAVAAALAPKSDASPDFLVSLYGPSLVDVNVPEHAPPLFMAVGNAHFNVTNGMLALFAAWKAAGKPAELHIYDQVSAGFGMTKRGLPVDGWTDRLHEWLVARQITTK